MTNTGWITFTDARFAPVTDVLVSGLLSFSKHDIEVVSLGFDYASPSSRVIVRRMDTPYAHRYWPYIAKWYGVLLSSFRAGVVLDADNVPNRHCDECLEMAAEHSNLAYPLCSHHESDPKNQEELMEFFGVTRKSMPYVQANFLFGEGSKRFFVECIEMAHRVLHSGIEPHNLDESILNINLWRYGAVKQCVRFIPFAGSNFPRYLVDSPQNPQNYDTDVPTFHFFHGAKNAAGAATLLTRLQAEDLQVFAANPHKSRRLTLYEA